MPMPRIIRIATPKDAAQCANIYASHVRDSAVSFEVDVPTAEEFQARIARTLERLPWLVCAEGDAVLGYAYAAPHQERAAFQWSVNVSVYVLDGHGREGIGRALYTSLFACLRAMGYYNAYAAIALPNQASVGLHEAMGFRHIGTFADVGHKLGEWHALGWWGLSLQPPSPPSAPVPLAKAVGTAAWFDAVATGERLLG